MRGWCDLAKGGWLQLKNSSIDTDDVDVSSLTVDKSAFWMSLVGRTKSLNQVLLIVVKLIGCSKTRLMNCINQNKDGINLSS